MKKEVISIKYSAERLRAIRSQLEKWGSSLDEELNDLVDGIYKKYVKPEVREFIEEAEKQSHTKETKSRKDWF